MARTRFLQAVLIAGTLLTPSLAVAGVGPHSGGASNEPLGGVFSGIGNLWGGATRTAGAPPGCVPGVPCGQMAHYHGLAHQNGSQLPHRWTKQGINAVAHNG